MTTYLKFPGNSQRVAALHEAGLMRTDDDGEDQVHGYSQTHALHIIGPITRVTRPAEYDEDGNETRPAELKTLPGVYAMIKGTIPEALEAFVIDKPEGAPVFAGD